MPPDYVTANDAIQMQVKAISAQTALVLQALARSEGEGFPPNDMILFAAGELNDFETRLSAISAQSLILRDLADPTTPSELPF